jgi:predicted lysophospholipase L1 biosynthesis ABC-type transport system permease subunit
VLGVMPAGFAMPHARIDVWLPWDMRESYSPPRFPAGSPRDFRFLSVLARLKPGITRAQAEKQIETLAASMADRYPKTNRGWSMALTSYYDEVVGSSRGLLLALFGAVGMVLLIACANVSSMLTARAAVRRHEFAVRIAIGAPRFRLVRQLLTESVVLAAIGGTCGLAIAYSGLQSLVALAPAGLPRIEQTAVDPYVLGFTLLVTLAAGVGFGLAPALQASTAGWKARGSYRRFLNTMVVARSRSH